MKSLHRSGSLLFWRTRGANSVRAREMSVGRTRLLQFSLKVIAHRFMHCQSKVPAPHKRRITSAVILDSWLFPFRCWTSVSSCCRTFPLIAVGRPGFGRTSSKTHRVSPLAILREPGGNRCPVVATELCELVNLGCLPSFEAPQTCTLLARRVPSSAEAPV